MSSFATRIAKRIATKSMTKEERREARQGKSQWFENTADSKGYRTYHPTKGWRTVSFKRVAAQQIVARLKGGLAL